MDQNRDLLPWILCGLAIATAVVAIGVNSIKAPLTMTHTVPVLSAPTATLAATVLPATPPAPATPVAPQSAPPVAEHIEGTTEQAAEGTASGSQIWACTINGTKTFSSNPCGDKSSLVEVGPINTMESTRVYPPLRGYAAQPVYQPNYPSEEPPEQASEGYPSYGDGYASYGVVAAAPHYVRRRPWHAHPSPHNRAAHPQKY